MISYSQVGQDEWVLDYFGRNYKGYFVDVGAYDGIEISNTYLLENTEWRGICIEPNPSSFSQLLLNRKSLCLNVVISDTDDYCLFIEETGKDAGFSRIGETGKKTRCFTLKTIFSYLYIPNNKIDYLSIDTEGNELKVLCGVPFDTHKIELITVEHNAYGKPSEHKDSIFYFLKDRGYERVRENVGWSEGFEDWYCKK